MIVKRIIMRMKYISKINVRGEFIKERGSIEMSFCSQWFVFNSQSNVKICKHTKGLKYFTLRNTFHNTEIIINIMFIPLLETK